MCYPDPYGNNIPKYLKICDNYEGYSVPHLLNIQKIEKFNFNKSIKFFPTFVNKNKFIKNKNYYRICFNYCLNELKKTRRF